MAVELLRRVHLLQDPVAEHRHALAERHRLDLIVRHVDGGGLETLVQQHELPPHLHAELRVEVGERFVHQERPRVADDRPTHRDPLALAAREIRRLAVEVLSEVKDLSCLGDLAIDLLLRGIRELQREGHVLAYGHVRVESVVLEHHRDVALLGRHLVDHGVADPQLALGDVLEPSDHPKSRRLAAARGPDQDHELPVGDVQAHVLDGLEAVREALADSLEDDLSHCLSSFIP